MHVCVYDNFNESYRNNNVNVSLLVHTYVIYIHIKQFTNLVYVNCLLENFLFAFFLMTLGTCLYFSFITNKQQKRQF